MIFRASIIATVLALTAGLGWRFWQGEREIFMPGETTHGHYQIEVACDSCHTGAFADRDAIQQGCVECHGDQLAVSDDSHPRKKFTDPRNADRVEVLDARYCATCHQEHLPQMTGDMGLTLPEDYCYRCHEAVGEERESHAALPFDSCSSGGCHNFHDNRALYEDFLAKHLNEPAQRSVAFVPVTTPSRPAADRRALGTGDVDVSPSLLARAPDWAGTLHAESGVNCGDCHGRAAALQESPSHEACAECHPGQAAGFLQARHGMRIGRGLPPMRPGDSRLPMHVEAADLQVTCNSCHPAHAFDRQSASVDACQGCHADPHSEAYPSSKHAALFEAELAGALPEGSGVTCATCHFPRHREGKSVRVSHDANDTLRPNEKMIRAVCLDCHGLAFAIDSLADPALVASNFQGLPARSIESLSWVERRLEPPAQDSAAAEIPAPR